MKICNKVEELEDFLSEFRKQGKVIGFVPTMGALHSGHLSLVEKCRAECNITVASIFVNPLQFNDKNDYNNYPKTLKADSEGLSSAGCDIVFIPDEKEMYPVRKDVHYDLGLLEEIMEGKHRPGHFQGVARVVERLFDIVKPDKAYFGAKDFQQIMVIKRMIAITKQSVEIVICPTKRESDGLAMSSRNMRLNEVQRKSAPALYHALSQIPEMLRSNDFKTAESWFFNYIDNVPFLKAEYIDVADPDKLEIIRTPVKGSTYIAFAAVYCGEVRLIDNIFFVM